AAMILVCLLAGGMYIKRGSGIKTLLLSGTVESHEIQVGSKVGGRVSEVLVNEGNEVKTGELLVRFDISELFAERQKLEARIEQAEANLRKLQVGYRPEEIAQAEAATGKERASLEALRNGARPQEL